MNGPDRPAVRPPHHPARGLPFSTAFAFAGAVLSAFGVVGGLLVLTSVSLAVDDEAARGVAFFDDVQWLAGALVALSAAVLVIALAHFARREWARRLTLAGVVVLVLVVVIAVLLYRTLQA